MQPKSIIGIMTDLLFQRHFSALLPFSSILLISINMSIMDILYNYAVNSEGERKHQTGRGGKREREMLRRWRWQQYGTKQSEKDTDYAVQCIWL